MMTLAISPTKAKYVSNRMNQFWVTQSWKDRYEWLFLKYNFWIAFTEKHLIKWKCNPYYQFYLLLDLLQKPCYSKQPITSYFCCSCQIYISVSFKGVCSSLFFLHHNIVCQCRVCNLLTIQHIGLATLTHIMAQHTVDAQRPTHVIELGKVFDIVQVARHSHRMKSSFSYQHGIRPTDGTLHWAYTKPNK